ncbi:MAG TPA: MarR family transcriptional regulator [Steroidobacteraceae bacterium]|jgi:DNA-binding MarR family transcriptional regulator|nr:MarR family transcriptional regulator [Steroidobacteraceae bacterium]
MSSEQARRATIADALHSGAIKLLRMVRSEDAAAGIGPAQLSALSVLVFMGEKTVGELAALEQVRAPTMSRIADGLVERQLVQRHSATTDRRRVRLAVTAEGRKLLLAGKDRRVRALAKRLEAFTAGELTTLKEAARLIERL